MIYGSEFIKQVPEKFHQHLQEGNFLAAAQLLVKASDMLAQEDLDVINALIDRKREIRSLRQVQIFISLSEICSHICWTPW